MVGSFKDIDLTGIKGILLDLDDTLYPYEPCHLAALEACCANFLFREPSSNREQFTDLYQAARKSTGKNLKGLAPSHSRLLYFQKILESYYNRTRFDLSLEFEELYWGTFMKAMALSDEAESFLKKCKDKQIEVCLVTDLTAQIQHRKINKLGIMDSIRFMVTSEEAGIEKPGKKIFEMALEKLSLTMKEVIMIGDSMEKDIAGAQALGIKAYHIKP
jgi:HAD superfamily hydrolase (TIGR01549 family)